MIVRRLYLSIFSTPLTRGVCQIFDFGLVFDIMHVTDVRYLAPTDILFPRSLFLGYANVFRPRTEAEIQAFRCGSSSIRDGDRRISGIPVAVDLSLTLLTHYITCHQGTVIHSMHYAISARSGER